MEEDAARRTEDSTMNKIEKQLEEILGKMSGMNVAQEKTQNTTQSLGQKKEVNSLIELLRKMEGAKKEQQEGEKVILEKKLEDLLKAVVNTHLLGKQGATPSDANTFQAPGNWMGFNQPHNLNAYGTSGGYPQYGGGQNMHPMQPNTGMPMGNIPFVPGTQINPQGRGSPYGINIANPPSMVHPHSGMPHNPMDINAIRTDFPVAPGMNQQLLMGVGQPFSPGMANPAAMGMGYHGMGIGQLPPGVGNNTNFTSGFHNFPPSPASSAQFAQPHFSSFQTSHSSDALFHQGQSLSEGAPPSSYDTSFNTKGVNVDSSHLNPQGEQKNVKKAAASHQPKNKASKNKGDKTSYDKSASNEKCDNAFKKKEEVKTEKNKEPVEQKNFKKANNFNPPKNKAYKNKGDKVSDDKKTTNDEKCDNALKKEEEMKTEKNKEPAATNLYDDWVSKLSDIFKPISFDFGGFNKDFTLGEDENNGKETNVFKEEKKMEEKENPSASSTRKKSKQTSAESKTPKKDCPEGNKQKENVAKNTEKQFGEKSQPEQQGKMNDKIKKELNNQPEQQGNEKMKQLNKQPKQQGKNNEKVKKQQNSQPQQQDEKEKFNKKQKAKGDGNASSQQQQQSGTKPPPKESLPEEEPDSTMQQKTGAPQGQKPRNKKKKSKGILQQQTNQCEELERFLKGSIPSRTQALCEGMDMEKQVSGVVLTTGTVYNIPHNINEIITFKELHPDAKLILMLK